MLNEAMGQFHFWVTFLGAYAIFFPMHYVGLVGVPRRYPELGETAFVTDAGRRAQRLHQRGRADRRRRADGVPVQPRLEPAPRAAVRRQSLARDHAGMADAGNAARARQLGRELPVVYRWAYDYSVPGAPAGFRPAERALAERLRTGPAMSVILVFVLVLIVLRLLVAAPASGVMSKPWLEIGADPLGGPVRDRRMPTEKLGLGVFLAVVGALFALFASAYFMRMEYVDWRHAADARGSSGSTPASWCSRASRCTARSPPPAGATPRHAAAWPRRRRRRDARLSSPASSSPGANSARAAIS